MKNKPSLSLYGSVVALGLLIFSTTWSTAACYTGTLGSICTTNAVQGAFCANGCVAIIVTPTHNSTCRSTQPGECGRSACQTSVVNVTVTTQQYTKVTVNGVCRCVEPVYSSPAIPTGETCSVADFSGGSSCGSCGGQG